MPERERRSESLRAAAPLRVGAVTLIPIERVVVRSARRWPGVWASAALEPYALVVRDAGGVRAVGLDAEAVPLERLRELIPELEDLLASP